MITVNWFLLALCALAVFAIGWVAGRNAAGTSSLSVRPTRAFTELGPALRAEIEAAIAEGHKMEAIKLLREATGMDLKESTELVDAMERP